MSTVVDFTSAGTIGVELLPQRYDISIYEGDTFEFCLVFTDASGNLVDITGWTAVSSIKFATTNLPAEVDAFDIKYYDGPLGKITVALDFSASQSLSAGEYKYDVQVSDAAQPMAHKRTYIGGKITVVGDIT